MSPILEMAHRTLCCNCIDFGMWPVKLHNLHNSESLTERMTLGMPTLPVYLTQTLILSCTPTDMSTAARITVVRSHIVALGTVHHARLGDLVPTAILFSRVCLRKLRKMRVVQSAHYHSFKCSLCRFFLLHYDAAGTLVFQFRIVRNAEFW